MRRERDNMPRRQKEKERDGIRREGRLESGMMV